MPRANAVLISRVGSSSQGTIEAVLHNAMKIKRDAAKVQWLKLKLPSDCFVKSTKKVTN